MAEPSISELNLLTLKHGNSYAIFDRSGDIAPALGLMGIYVDDMRYSSALTLMLGGKKPVSAGAQVSEDNTEIVSYLSNAAFTDESGVTVPENTVHIERRITLCDGMVHQKISVENFNPFPVSLPFDIGFDSDFVDMFNVRGQDPKKVLGEQKAPEITDNFARVNWLYKGVDRKELKSSIFFSSDPKPQSLSETEARFVFPLKPRGKSTFYLEFGKYKDDAAGPGAKSYDDAVNVVRHERAAFLSQGARLQFSNAKLQAWFDRSGGDIAFLTNHYPSGPYPCAGAPWFAVPFGRDGIITALEMLWAKPDIAKGVLQFLSDRQAMAEDAHKDAEPGKIMHETRENEMSRAGMVPYGLYYGGVDTTILYVILAGEYLQQTGDTEFVKKIWPHIESALKWMETYAEDTHWSKEDAQGFLMYQRKLESGLYNQMWKDSGDSVFYENGDTNVTFPRAVCEVQGYAYAAWNTGKKLAEVFHQAAAAKHYAAKAETLYKNFNKKFWNEEGQYYVLALDGKGKACNVKASNMGQLLFTGIVPPDRAEKIVKMLMGEKLFTGFGIRTVATDEARYNPLSYHNGSVWPHDTALIAAGMAKSGHAEDAAQLFSGLLQAAQKNGWRLPELFGGFAKEDGSKGPVSYPHACSPQAWAAAAPYQLLQALLGLEIDAEKRTVKISAASWRPEWGTLNIRALPVGDKTVDLDVSARGIKVLRAEGVKIFSPGKPAGRKAAPHKTHR